MSRDPEAEGLIRKLLSASDEGNAGELNALITQAETLQRMHGWNHRLGDAVSAAMLSLQTIVAQKDRPSGGGYAL